MNRLLYCAVLTATLAGCASTTSGPISELQLVPPATWSVPLTQPGDAQPLANWWVRFGDPLLPGLIEHAEKASPTLDQVTARLRQARASAGIAQASRLPQLNGGVSSSRSRSDDVYSSTSSGAFDASWELDLFGGKQHANEAATARADAARFNWHQARVSLAAEVASTYFSLRQCRAAAVITGDDVASRRVTLSLVRAKVEAGAAARSELDRAEASTAEGESSLAEQLGACARIEHQLAALTALPTAELKAQLGATGRLPVVTSEGFSLLPAQVLAQRPDLAAARQSVLAAGADIGVAKADLLPSMTLIGSLGVNTSSSRGVSLTSHGWSFGPSINLPIFDGGRRKANLEVAAAGYDEAVATWRQSVLVAVQEVEDALSRVATAQARWDAASLAASRYDSYLQATQVRFKEGAASLLELEDARRTALSARATRLALVLEHAQARVALYKSAGGGWADSTVSTTQQ